MASLVSIDMPSDTAEFTSVTSSGGGSFTWNGGTGPDGSTGFARVTAANGGIGRALKTFTALGVVAGCRGGVMINPTSLTQGNNEVLLQMRIWNGSDSGTVVRCGVKTISSQRYVRFETRNDAGSLANSSDVAITNAAHWIEIDVVKETSDGAANGVNTFYIDDSQVAQHTGVDNFNNVALINRVSVGYESGDCPSGTSGTTDLDRLRFRNDNTLIGGPSSAPTVTDISNQTGYFGTPKSVACTIADTANDIVRCDVSTGGTALITLTASGSATVTNNGTTAPYVTGTHTDVVATLGNNISLSGVRAGTELSHVETITVLVTDSEDATGNDTFTMTWSVPTGVGTQTLHLQGTQAQINAALATAEVTATVLETIQCRMYSVTSTPLTDTDIFNITAVIPTDSSPLGLHTTLKRRRRGA